MKHERVLILGAAGRDFHNFNVVYRDDPATTVIAFTVTQIPANRRSPLSHRACGPPLSVRNPDRGRIGARSLVPSSQDVGKGQS